MTNRIEKRFSDLKKNGQAGFIPFITAGDPDYKTSLELLKALPNTGASLIELGMPFSDPVADGPVIQKASSRALKAGQTLIKTLRMVKEFRKDDTQTPIVLMGYYNPIYRYGVTAFLKKAKAVGVDGLLVVDLPPEEDAELCLPALEQQICFIRLSTPTTDEHRLPIVLDNASGFLYYVSVLGVTGKKAAQVDGLEKKISWLRQRTSLPIGVGFGIKKPQDVAKVAQFANGVVVGSAIVQKIADNLDENDKPRVGLVGDVMDYVTTLAQACKIV